MRFRILTVLLALAAFAAPAAAWNKPGHMVSAAIAHAALKKDNPAALARVIALLKQHPHYESMWVPRLEAIPNLTQEEKDLYLFMQAARWADDIRDKTEFHRGEWHYINLPYKPKGQPDSVQPKVPSSNNIVRAFELNRNKAKSGSESVGERAIALTWLFHLVGDGHQPLHATALYTTDYPKGDKGGNLIFIRVKPEAQSVIKLHEFWDDLIIGSDRFQSVRNKATELRLRDDLLKEKLIELRGDKGFEHWMKQETFKLAVDKAYLNGAIPGSPDRDKVVVLPPGYIQAAKAVAEKQIVLAGYRLAETLRQVVN